MAEFFKTIASDFGYLGNAINIGGALNFLLVGLAFIFIMLVSYLLGSINFAIIISGRKYKEDIRSHGSKNAGMTNMMRTYGKKAAVFTLLGDALKAIVSCCIGYLVMGEVGAYAAGLFCMLGHVFPLYYGFKGGKGVVTAAATVLMTDPVVFLLLLTLFIIMVAIWRYISLASITCIGLYPLILSFMSNLIGYPLNPLCLIFSIFMAALIIGKHWQNVQRLRTGTESKFSFKKSVKSPTTETEKDIKDNEEK